MKHIETRPRGEIGYDFDLLCFLIRHAGRDDVEKHTIHAKIHNIFESSCFIWLHKASTRTCPLHHLHVNEMDVDGMTPTWNDGKYIAKSGERGEIYHLIC